MNSSYRISKCRAFLSSDIVVLTSFEYIAKQPLFTFAAPSQNAAWPQIKDVAEGRFRRRPFLLTLFLCHRLFFSFTFSFFSFDLCCHPNYSFYYDYLYLFIIIRHHFILFLIFVVLLTLHLLITLRAPADLICENFSVDHFLSFCSSLLS